MWGSQTKRWKMLVVISDMAECKEKDGEQL